LITCAVKFLLCVSAMTRLSNNKHIIKPRTGPLAAALTPEWAELLNLTPDPYARSSLNRLFRLASHLNLKPDEVCNETLQRLEDAAAGENITRPKQVSRDAARYWNSMRELHPQWPRQVLTPPAHRKVSIKLQDMPEAFQEDVAKFFDRDVEIDIFEAPTRQIKSPITIEDSCNKIMQIVTYAVKLGVPLNSIKRLEDLGAQRIAEPVLDKLYNDAGQGPHAHSNRLAKIILRIAKSTTQRETKHILCLEKADRKLRVKDKGISKKMWDRLRLLLDEENAIQILLLSEDVVAACDISNPRITDAWELQSALIVSLLLTAPMKEAILASLDIKRHFKKERNDLYRLVIPEAETTNGQELNYPIQGSVLKILKLYLKVYLPLLAPPTNTKLLVSRTGRQKQAHEISSQIDKFIQKRTELKMNVGLFRHFFAYLKLRQNKDDFESVRSQLSHVFSETTHTFYGDFKKQQSFEMLDNIIKTKRRMV